MKKDRFTGMIIHYCVGTVEHRRYYATECPICGLKDIATKDIMRKHMEKHIKNN